jgi:CDI immunity protein
MPTQRPRLKICGDWEPLFPVQALFNAIGDDSFLDVVRHLLNRQGYSSDYCHCHFPADLDPQAPTFDGVQFSHFDDVIVITETQFADVLDRVILDYRAVDDAGAFVLSRLVSEFRHTIRGPEQSKTIRSKAND